MWIVYSALNSMLHNINTTIYLNQVSVNISGLHHRDNNVTIDGDDPRDGGGGGVTGTCNCAINL